MYNNLSISPCHHPVSKPLVFISVSSFGDFCEQHFMLECLSLMCPCVLDYYELFLVVTFVQYSLTHLSAAASMLLAVQTPILPSSCSLLKMLLQYAFIPAFSQPPGLSRAPHRQIKLQGAKSILLPFSSLLP